MAQDQYASFGQGAEGFGKYFGKALWPVCRSMHWQHHDRGVIPIMLHQDPRYFAEGKGGFWKRTGYAIAREAITRGDDGRNHFNRSELLGNAVAAGISNAYYPAADPANKWGQQIGLDTGST
jgi:hypothetical protein